MKKFMRIIIDTMQEGLMLVDPEGQVIFVNKAFENMLGYTAEELKGKKCDIFQCNRCYTHQLGDPRKNCTLFQKESIRNNECFFIKKDGHPLHLLKNCALICDKNGTIIGGVESLIDISAVVAKENVIANLRQRLHSSEGFQGIIGNSSSLHEMQDLSLSAAQSNAPIIIYGAPGTGKELLACAIHENSLRREQPFIKVNCAALNENLLESELFGHIKGVFTGADFSRKGKFEAAQGGTIFLDEIGDLPLNTQTKLLRVLQDKEIERVGDHKPISINVRIIASTHKDLHLLIREGLFREDLYYRINVVPIPVPSLQDRKQDIPLLVETFMQRIAKRTSKPISSISKEALEILMDYSWPGNIRELMNALEYSFVLCTGSQIGLNHLPVNIIHPESATS
jgi:PAS domain S-box-containing protein